MRKVDEKERKVFLSVVVPVYRSSSTLQEVYKRTVAILKRLDREFEIIFVDDGSPDSCWIILEKLYRKDKRVIIIQLAQNYGQHNAIMCGFSYAKGDYVVTIDDDLQTPPEEIPKLVKKIKEGYDVVYGEYRYKKHSPYRNIGSLLIQQVYKYIFKAKGNLTSFRIIRKSIVKKILSYNKNYTFIDGLLCWYTKNIGYVRVRHAKRAQGKSGYSFSKLLLLSLNMLTNFSVFPLQLASITGVVFSLIGLMFALFIVVKKILYDIPVTGFASLIVSILIFSGIQLLTIGLIGEYIGRIHLNLNKKPQYSIKRIKRKL